MLASTENYSKRQLGRIRRNSAINNCFHEIVQRLPLIPMQVSQSPFATYIPTKHTHSFESPLHTHIEKEMYQKWLITHMRTNKHKTFAQNLRNRVIQYMYVWHCMLIRHSRSAQSLKLNVELKTIHVNTANGEPSKDFNTGGGYTYLHRQLEHADEVHARARRREQLRVAD